MHHQLEAVAQILQTDSVRIGRRYLRIYRIGYFQFVAVVEPDGYVHPVVAVYHIVHRDIFYERQQRQHRQPQAALLRGDIYFKNELPLEPHLHHMPESPDEFQFLVERDQPFAVALQDITENVRQLRDIQQCIIVIPFAHERLDAVQRIEEKVRIDLVHECVATALQTLDFQAFDLLFLLAATIVQHGDIADEGTQQTGHEELEQQDISDIACLNAQQRQSVGETDEHSAPYQRVEEITSEPPDERHVPDAPQIVAQLEKEQPVEPCHPKREKHPESRFFALCQLFQIPRNPHDIRIGDAQRAYHRDERQTAGYV